MEIPVSIGRYHAGLLLQPDKVSELELFACSLHVSPRILRNAIGDHVARILNQGFSTVVTADLYPRRIFNRKTIAEATFLPGESSIQEFAPTDADDFLIMQLVQNPNGVFERKLTSSGIILPEARALYRSAILPKVLGSGLCTKIAFIVNRTSESTPECFVDLPVTDILNSLLFVERDTEDPKELYADIYISRYRIYSRPEAVESYLKSVQASAKRSDTLSSRRPYPHGFSNLRKS